MQNLQCETVEKSLSGVCGGEFESYWVQSKDKMYHDGIASAKLVSGEARIIPRGFKLVARLRKENVRVVEYQMASLRQGDLHRHQSHHPPYQ